MMEQPEAIRKTFDAELDNMANISKIIESVDSIYLIGCGSSISTCYSVRDALASVSTLNIEVFTGYEFVYNKKLINGENSIVISTSQSGETADTLAALRRAKEYDIKTVSISNEPQSSMIKEADYPVITLGDTETAILGTKTYMAQLACLYQILFKASDYDKSDEVLEQLAGMPDLIEDLLKTTEEENKKLACELKDEDIFYCLGSGVNFGLAYKLAMTMLMEGAIKHACPLYAAEFRHGLIERNLMRSPKGLLLPLKMSLKPKQSYTSLEIMLMSMNCSLHLCLLCLWNGLFTIWLTSMARILEVQGISVK